MRTARTREAIGHQELLNYLSYDKETGAFRRSTFSVRHAGYVLGTVNSNGYFEISIHGTHYACARLAWFYIRGAWPNGWVDHIDGDTLNNRMSNLRIATEQQSSFNRGIPSSNTSGFRGVVYLQKQRKWWARMFKNGKWICMGSAHKTPESASMAYEAKAREIHGEFYRPPERHRVVSKIPDWYIREHRPMRAKRPPGWARVDRLRNGINKYVWAHAAKNTSVTWNFGADFIASEIHGFKTRFPIPDFTPETALACADKIADELAALPETSTTRVYALAPLEDE